MRKHLKHTFNPETSSLESAKECERKGFHHWETSRWFTETQAFLHSDLSLKEMSERNVWAAVLLLYPALGPSKKFACHQDIITNLGQEGILIYKEIFDKNREQSRDLFLNDNLIR